MDHEALSAAVEKQFIWVELLKKEMGRVLVGQADLVDRLIIGLLTNGHILLEGVPGLAKTLAIKSLAGCMKADFSRLQFTPDLLPADLLGTMIYSRFLVVTEVPMFLSETIAVLDVSPYIVLIICLTFYIPIGFIMDIMAMLMLTVPILHPVLVALGFDPVWLAVLTIITVLMGHISPPVGIVVFGLAGYVRDVPVDTIFRGVLPFLLTMLVCLAILIAVPEISLLLPNLMKPG